MTILPEYPFLLPILVMVLAELTKHVKEGFTHGRILFHSGGMPSSHSAFMASLLYTVGHIDGLQSTTFAVVAVLSLIIWYDAICVRSQIGVLARTLNTLSKKKHQERVGHTGKEVLAGIAFGLAVSWLLIFFFWS